jgi:hypothetical protein
MQQALGNQAVQQMAVTCPAFPSACPTGGACHTCPVRLQAKLAISQPGDPYEQEADRMTGAVMRMPEPPISRVREWQGRQGEGEAATLQRKCAACASGQGLCPQCAEEERTRREPLAAQINPLVQRQVTEELDAKKAPAGSRSIEGEESVPPIVYEVLRSPGQPLDQATRAFFEPRFGHDFSQVRVHTDAKAAESARAVNALAYTVGRDIVFAAGQYAPGTTAGRHVIAHELTHIIQQHGSAHLQRAAAPTSHEEMLDVAINIVQQALDTLIAPASEDDGQPVAAGNEERAQNLRTALDNLLALKGSGKEDEILRAVQPILAAAKSNTSGANPSAAVQRKAVVGHEGDAFEREAETVARRVSQGYAADDLIQQEVAGNSTEIIQRQGGPGVAVLVESGPVGWAILAGIAIAGLGIYLATRARSRPCPPCPPNPPPEIDRVPPSAPHYPCPGDHWHYRVYNQNPQTCDCFLSGRLFGGCCGESGAPC